MSASRRARLFSRLLVVALFITFDLVMFGAFVRISDAGLGCPDWPGCYGKVTPFGAMQDIQAAALERPHGPATVFKAWVEMLHRYAASALGLLIICLAWLAWRLRRQDGGRQGRGIGHQQHPDQPLAFLAERHVRLPHEEELACAGRFAGTAVDRQQDPLALEGRQSLRLQVRGRHIRCRRPLREVLHRGGERGDRPLGFDQDAVVGAPGRREHVVHEIGSHHRRHAHGNEQVQLPEAAAGCRLRPGWQAAIVRFAGHRSRPGAATSG